MKYFRFFICALLVLIVNNNAHAQYQIAQSRFITEAGPFSQTCSIGGGNNAGDCMPNVNGVVYIRFDTERLRIDDNGTPDDARDDRLEFVVQVRKTGAALPYSVGGMAIDYNAEAFGENLNAPAFYDNDTDTATNLGQCTYTKGNIFSDTQDYVFTFRDTSPSLLSLFAEADDFTSSTATANSFATINNQWQDFVEFSCQITYDADDNGTLDANEGSSNADAGLAFSGRLWAENQVWIARDGGASTANRIVFGIADNDLRGFRLDGKTWVEDYARHDDGRGVRLKFSKGVAAYDDGDTTTPTPLTAANFIIDGAGDAVKITTATHRVNEPYVNLRFESAVSNGILRLLSSTTTRIVRDVDNVELADGNFVAALAYDTNAPQVTAVRRTVYTGNNEMGESIWEIGFSEALHPDTVSKDNLCLTDNSGICASADKPATTLTIVSVDLNDENSILSVVINEGRIGQASSPISLEFRRNAVLGADFKIVEDYQTALRDEITLSNDVPLVITVRAIDMRVDANPDPNIETIYQFEAVPNISPTNGNRYTMQFAVQASRPILEISDESSYQLIAVPIDENEPVPASSMTVVLRATESSRSGDATTLTYVVELDSVAATQRIRGFTLARGINTNFVDTRGIPPAINVGDVLDAAAAAIARRDTQPPNISVVQSLNAINSNGYSLRFDITADEILQPSVAPEFYTLLRRLDGGGYAVVTSPVDFSIRSINLSSYSVGAEVRLSEAEARDTVGLTLGYGGDGVRDLANNDPITIGPYRLFDDSDGALAATNQTHPSISVIAQGAVMPDEDDPLMYRGAFEVTANTILDAGIDGANGIVGLSDGASYWLWHIPSPSSSGAPSTRTAQITVDAVTVRTSATISFTTFFANSNEVMQTMGFTLARRNNLQDFAGNTPVDPVNSGDEIARGERLDSRNQAVALRDDEPPNYMVAREGSLRIAASGYTMAFRVSAPSDVPSTQFSDLRQSGSYSLLRKLQGSNTFEVMPGRLAEEIAMDDAVIVRYINVPRLSINDALNTEGFTLGRSADDRLRDVSNNDPVVSIGGTTPTEVTITPPLPLDASAQALFTIGRDSPSLTVTPNLLEPNLTVSRHNTRYSGSFNVNNTDGKGIDGIESSQSYVLLRVPQRIDAAIPSTPVVVLQTANVSVGSANFNDLTDVAIHFSVDDPEATSKHRFSLGRKDRLSDLVGNPLVDPMTGEEVTTNSRIDSRATAEAQIPAANTPNPIVSVVAANGKAVATNNPLVYGGSFEVSVINDKDVSGIAHVGSYNLLQIAKDGMHTISTATATIQVNDATTADVLGQMATVVFSTTLTVTSLEQTYGFTLGRRANLESGDGTLPLVDASRGNRLDAAATAVAVLDSSLQITAEAIVDTSEALTRFPPFNQSDGQLDVPKAYPQVNFGDNTINGNRYSMIFEVRSLNGAAIPDISSTGSYVLLHVPTTGTAIDLTDYIVANTVEMVSFDQTQARVRYTVEFGANDDEDAVALTQRTAGFVLGRAAGKLQNDVPPLDSDGDFINDNDLINPNDTAIAKRDTTSPRIAVTVVGRSVRSSGIDINFILRTDSNERLQSQWSDGDDFVLLRRLRTSGWDIATGYGQSITIFGNIGSARDFSILGYRLSENDALNTEGFTLGYNGSSTLRDLSNNDVYQENEDDSINPLQRGQPFDIRDAAFLRRDMNPPFIKVAASTPTVASAQEDTTSYNIVFELASKKLDDDNQEFDARVRGLSSPRSYQLLRETIIGMGEENHEIIPSSAYVARREHISDYRARIIYENVRLSVPEAQQTLSFTLGRTSNNPNDVDDCPLCDYWSNAPVVAGTTQTATAGMPLDRSDTAKARIEDKTGELITISAISNALPDSRNANIYSGSFEVRGNDSISGLSDVSSYTLLRLPRVGADGFGEAMETPATLMLSADSSMTTSARITFKVDLNSIAITQRTYGFTLGRAGASMENDCVLCDPSSNLPVGRDGTTIPAGAPLDATTTAIVRRDIEPPRITVIPIGKFVDVQPNRYTMGFRLTASSDVTDAIGSELRSLSTYRLLRKLNTDNSYQMVSAVPSQAISPSGNIELIYNDVLPLSIEEISKTESFTLGLAIAGRLRDKSGNDPVASVGGALVTVDPPSPLDESTTAHLAVSRVGNPAISVTHDQDFNLLTKKGANYTGTFDLVGNRSIDGITSSESYVLLRVPQRTDTTMPSTPVVVLNDAHISISDANLNDLQSATIYFAVSDPDATSKHGFALGRKARLTDLVGNPLIDPADNGLVGIDERIDSRLSAEAPVPTTDTRNPIITVRANGKAVPSSDNRLEYRGSFRVSSDEMVDGFNQPDSYKLLHIDDERTHTTITASLSVNTTELVPAEGEVELVRVSFSTELSAAQLLKTVGFTLGHRANLEKGGIPPIVDKSRQDRLDASSDAIARIDRPLLINAKAIADTQNPLVRGNLVPDNIKAYPDLDNGNKYSMVFRVRSETGQAIPDIGSTSSYVLLHIPTPNGDVVNDLSSYIESNTVEMVSTDNTEAKVKYTVTFGDDASTTALTITRNTAGFALGRAAGRLQIATTKPLDKLGNLIADGAHIGTSTASIAMRDTTPPQIEIAVTENSANINGFVLSFGASTPPLEILRTGWNSSRNYTILRRLEGGGYTPVADALIGVEATRPLDNVRSINAMPFRLSQDDAQQTSDFTLAYGGASAIRDLANNDAVPFGSTQSLAINQPFDDRDSALAVRDTNPPFVEVRAQEIIPVDGGQNALPGGYYRLTFDLAFKKIVDGQSVAVPLHNNRRSYQLLRQTITDEFEVVRNYGMQSYRSGSSSATLSYNEVHLSPEEVEQTKSFTLGRAANDLDAAQYADGCRLCDYFANAPVVVGTTRTAMVGEPLDANARARSVIPQTVVRLAVSAVGIAEPNLSDGNEYTMNFRVESDETIASLGALDSYKLIHKPTDGNALDLTTFTIDRSITSNSSATEAMLYYRVIFNDVENQTQRTAGFTLARTARLVDTYGNPATNRQGEPIAIGEEISTTSAAIAIRDTKPPSIAIDAKEGKATQTTKGSNIYNMQFLVTVPNGEQVRGLADINSYALLQILANGAVMFPNSTATVTTTASGFEINYNDVQISQDDSNPTIGFTLGRAGSSLRDLANNDPVDANPENATEKIDEADEELDSRSSALAQIIRTIFVEVRVFLEGANTCVGADYFPLVARWQAQPDEVVVKGLHKAIPLLWRGGRLRLTGWL